MLDKDQPLFHPEDRKNIDAYIAKVRGYDKEPEIPVSMSVDKTEWPRLASMFGDLFINICPLPKITPEEIDSIQDHFGNKADIIDIDEFKTKEGNGT